MNQQQILRKALAARNEEVLTYQINIDNYAAAIASIDANYAGNANLAQFRAELANRLRVEQEQQLRSIVIRDVIAAQIKPLPLWRQAMEELPLFSQWPKKKK
jgi:hypothetical protein